MVRHTLVRGAFATALGIALTAGGMVPLAAPAAADTPSPQEVVVPPGYKSTPRNAFVYQKEQAAQGDADSVGSEGVFHREQDVKETLWTRFSDGRSVPISEPQDWVLPRGTGTDALAYVRPDRIELRYADGAVRTITVPRHLTGAKVYGSAAVAFDTTAKTAHVLSARADGTTGDVEIEKPETFAYTTAAGGDTRSIVLPGPVTEGKRRHAVVDAETGRLQGLTPPVPASYTRVKLSPKHLAFYSTESTNGTVLVASRTDLAAPPVKADLTSYDLPLDHLAVVGDWLVLNASNDVVAVPVAGGSAPVVLVAHSYGIASGPDGTAVAVGGTGPADWAIRRITADADGKPVVTTVKRLPGFPGHAQGIALAHGRLAVVDDSEYDGAGLAKEYVRDLGVTGGALTYGDRSELTGTPLETCPEKDALCSEYRALGDGRFLRRLGGYFVINGPAKGDFQSPYYGTGARIRDVNGAYLVVDVPGTREKQLVVALDGEKVLEERTPVASALWGSLLWTAGTDPGAVTAKDLTTGRTVETPDTGATCVPEELQAVGRWLYWSCGADGPAGVYDRTAKTSRSVPAGEALLGDGYVVTHDKAAGKLVLTGADGAAPVTRTVGTLPDTGVSQRHVRWTVDRFGGHLAHLDADEQVHVVPTGIGTQPLTVLDRKDTAVVRGKDETAPVTSVTLSKPAGAWTLTGRHTATGRVGELASGTEARGVLRPLWTGRDKAGDLLPNGTYTWTLTARPADGTGAEVRLTGSTVLRGGKSPASDPFTSVPTTRVMDTRDGTGVPKAKLGPKGTVTLTVGDVAGAPYHTTTAVVLNVTATNATAATYVSAYPYDTTRSSASNLNVPAGKTVANQVIVPVRNGKVTFYNHAGNVDLIADMAGYYTLDDVKGALYRPMTPWRALDTRSGLGAPQKPVQGGSRVHLGFAGSAVGSPDVTAVVLNVTATGVTRPTFVAALATGAPVVGSHLNPGQGETVSNLVVVPVVNGGIDLYNHSGAVDLVADVAGYFTGSDLGSLYEPSAPSRLMDTRDGTGVARAKVGAKGVVTLNVAGKGGVPATGATAVVLNVTATNATAATFVTAYPYGTTRTSASNLNVPAGRTVSNLVVVPVRDGKVTFYNHAGSVDLIADVQGFYAE
ncbi:hypothetical protein ACFXA4_31890 [Streptomyces sp. NPDC059442]|uniref:hypothetical protein n=1 Tax=Streptomyces sp. NPDC059442 TaxID=3346830 RepID=UPI00369BD9AD